MAIAINLDPVALRLGSLSIRWSALAYPATLIACAVTLFRLQRREQQPSFSLPVPKNPLQN